MSDDDLPRDVIDRTEPPATATPWRWYAKRAAIIVPLLGALILFGGVFGLYVQPPGVRAVMDVFGLDPGGGTRNPIAIPADRPGDASLSPPTLAAGGVVGLGRLMPNGDIVTVSPPFGSGDAPVQELRVSEGDTVTAAQIVATLANERILLRALETARAELDVRSASLAQTETSVSASRAETSASLERARAASDVAMRELARGDALLERGAIAQSAYDRLEADARQADEEVQRIRAGLSRYTGQLSTQADVRVAQSNVAAAEAKVRSAEAELEKAYVRAPSAGPVIAVHVQPGERPANDGVVDIGDLDAMKAEVEVHQRYIGSVRAGQTVQMTAEPLDAALIGVVADVGIEVKRQTLIGDDPAANADARVIEVLVDLDDASSERARAFTNLQVIATIDTEDNAP